MKKDLHSTSLKQLIQDITPRETDLLQGVVISTDPLRVQMVNDSKLIISKKISVTIIDIASCGHNIPDFLLL